MPNLHIPVAALDMQLDKNTPHYSELILENEIAGIQVAHVALAGGTVVAESARDNCKTIYLFIKGSGRVVAANSSYEIVPETILLPNSVEQISIHADQDAPLHYLKISAELTPQDVLDLQGFPARNTQTVYYAKFTDCQPYTEQIKSPNTVSRTILPNKIIPRIAMGTVQTTGPDAVGAHEHPMLEQLFLGLSDNSCVVHANDATAAFSEYAVLHIPLGSRHSVTVDKDKTMYYVWMDFFLNMAGEEWLKTHKVDDAV